MPLIFAAIILFGGIKLVSMAFDRKRREKAAELAKDFDKKFREIIAGEWGKDDKK